MKKEEYTVGQWCYLWFQNNQYKWNPNTKGGYLNLIEHHILPVVGEIPLSEFTEQIVTEFYDKLHLDNLSSQTIHCVHLLLRRCMDEAARQQIILFNPVRNCTVPKKEGHLPIRLRLGQIQRYLNTAEQFDALPMIYVGLTNGLRQCELITLSWADFHVPYKYIHRRGRLLTLNSKAAALLENLEPNSSSYVFLNPKTGQPYQLHELYYLHKRLLKSAGLPWICFRDLQRQCMEVRL